MEPFVRALVEGCRIKPAPPDSYNKLRQQLSAIGNNLNQLTHIANATGRISASQLDRAQSLLEDKAEDVSKLNRIYEQLGYAIPKVSTADRKKDPTRRQSDSNSLTRGKNPLDIDPRPSVRATIMALKNAARKAEQAQEKVQDITAKEER